MNWQTLLVKNGNNINEVAEVIKQAQAETGNPTLIELKKIIRF